MFISEILSSLPFPLPRISHHIPESNSKETVQSPYLLPVQTN